MDWGQVGAARRSDAEISAAGQDLTLRLAKERILVDL